MGAWFGELLEWERRADGWEIATTHGGHHFRLLRPDAALAKRHGLRRPHWRLVRDDDWHAMGGVVRAGDGELGVALRRFAEALIVVPETDWDPASVLPGVLRCLTNGSLIQGGPDVLPDHVRGLLTLHARGDRNTNWGPGAQVGELRAEFIRIGDPATEPIRISWSATLDGQALPVQGSWPDVTSAVGTAWMRRSL